jgi:hypothetical protein
MTMSQPECGVLLGRHSRHEFQVRTWFERCNGLSHERDICSSDTTARTCKPRESDERRRKEERANSYTLYAEGATSTLVWLASTACKTRRNDTDWTYAASVRTR